MRSVDQAQFGDIDAGFEEADHVFEDLLLYEGNRQLPIEQHASVGALDPFLEVGREIDRVGSPFSRYPGDIDSSVFLESYGSDLKDLWRFTAIAPPDSTRCLTVRQALDFLFGCAAGDVGIAALFKVSEGRS